MSLNKLDPLKSRSKNEMQYSIEAIPRIQHILVKSFSGTMNHVMFNDIDTITKVTEQPLLPTTIQKQRKRASTMAAKRVSVSTPLLNELSLSTQFLSNNPQDVDAVYFSNSQTELINDSNPSSPIQSQSSRKFSIFSRKKNANSSLTILPYSPSSSDPVDIDTILSAGSEIQLSPVISSPSKSNLKLDTNLTTQYTHMGTGSARRVNDRSPLSAYITSANDVNDILSLGYAYPTVCKKTDKKGGESHMNDVNQYANGGHVIDGEKENEFENAKENLVGFSYDVMNIDIAVESRDISSMMSKD